MLATGEFKLKVVMFADDEWWIAQCLDFDIAVQARRIEDLPYELERTLIGRIMVAADLGLNPFSGLPKAPSRYWDMYDKATEVHEEPKVPQTVQQYVERLELRRLAA